VDWRSNTDQSEDFQAYYRRNMEGIINRVKDRLA
jgi:hypothetical protein